MKRTVTFANRLLMLAIGCLLLGIVLLSAPVSADADNAADDMAAVQICPSGVATPRGLIAGDSWAQYMWDDDSHNDIWDKFGHGDKKMVGQSLGSDPGAGYTGPEYAISGSEARQWADTANFPWTANVIAELNANPTIDTVVLSIGGNDVLAGKSDSGWYKDMDLDVAGSEAALFATIEADTDTVIQSILASNNNMEVMISSYDYPNFNVPFLYCWIYACPKRDDLSRDATNDLITDAELNGMMVTVEQTRIGWANNNSRVAFDNSIGLNHHYYGDGNVGPGVLPKPGDAPPTYAPFPGGNPGLPSLRANFRSQLLVVDADPIHLDYDSYQYKISHQTESYFFPKFRGTPSQTFISQGGANDGWTDGANFGNNGIQVGEDTGDNLLYGIASFDTSAIPDNAIVTKATLYLQRGSGNDTSPFEDTSLLGMPIVDVQTGAFGAPSVEAGDATAAATAPNSACVHGTAKDDYYAVRADMNAAGINAINLFGLTQFRVSFPNNNPGLLSSDPMVDFKDGDGTLLRGADRIVLKEKVVQREMPDGRIVEETIEYYAIQHQGMAEVVGTTAPLLDIEYMVPLAVDMQGAPTTTSATLGIVLVVMAGMLFAVTAVVKRKPVTVIS